MATLEAPAATESFILQDDFEKIVRDHQRRIYRILYLLLHDHDAADTLTQECFLRAWSRRNSFRGDASLGTWLVRIAINLAQDQLKSRRQGFWRRFLRGKEKESASFADDRHSPEDTILLSERVGTIWAAVENLPPQRRTVFTLRFGEEMTLAEIAAAMKLREGTVKSHLYCAIDAIKRALAHQG
jgi:RNA polymerase sigma-70 factor, ECF subfamily